VPLVTIPAGGVIGNNAIALLYKTSLY